MLSKYLTLSFLTSVSTAIFAAQQENNYENSRDTY